MGQTQEVKVTRTCDSCGHSITLIQGRITSEELAASVGWYVVTKEHVIGVDQLMPIAKLACSSGCVLNLLSSGALELPTEKETIN